MLVLDTNVLSEVVRPAPSALVLQWLATQERATVFTTAISQAELLYGVERLPDGRRRFELAEGIRLLFSSDFKGRVLSFDSDAAHFYSKLISKREMLGRPMSQFDAMIAAIVQSQGAVLATRNIRDFELSEVRTINPWAD